MKLGTAHFHCPECDPVFVPGSTRAICGAVIPAPTVVSDLVVITKRCPDCKHLLAEHQASHRTAA